MQIHKDQCQIDSLPRVSFATLMELYETNYLRFRRLAPDYAKCGRHQISRVDGALDLHMYLLESVRFTTVARLTHHLPQSDGVVSPQPDFKLRIYRDARQVEALPPDGDEDEFIWRNRESLAQRWQANRFLYKWLGYCLQQGHKFVAAPARQTERYAETIRRQMV